MNLIRGFWGSIIYRSLFKLKLNKILRLYRAEVRKDFDVVDLKDSYWIKCNNDHVCPPRNVDENKELNGSLKQQAEMITKDWQYFATSDRKHFEVLVKYIVWLRSSCQKNKKQYRVHHNLVSDHIYEM